MASDLHPLPVTVQPHDAESGLGFLLRCCTANGMTMSVLRRWLDIHALRHTESQRIRALAFVTQVSEPWLQARLPRRLYRTSDKVIRYLDWGWVCGQVQRCERPQVCLACVGERRPCDLSWVCAGCVACAVHRQMLVDQCPHCNQPLDWARPAMDVCHCGRYLATGKPSRSIDGALAALMGDFRSVLHHGPIAGRRRWPSLPRWMDGMSPDGAIGVLHAVGVRERRFATVKVRPGSGHSRIQDLASALERGLDRIGQVDPAIARSIDGLRGWAHDEALALIARCATDETDARVATQLADWLGKLPKTKKLSRGPRARGQLDLFTGGRNWNDFASA